MNPQPARPLTRVTLIRGTPIEVYERAEHMLSMEAGRGNEVSVIISITPATHKNTPDSRGAPSRPGPADPINPMHETLLEAAAEARGNTH